MKEQKEVIIGIDLGTTYSCVAIWSGEGGQVISNKFGNRTTPSWVAYTDKERLIGEAAVNQAQSNTENTLYDSKRMIGRKFDDPFVVEDSKLWPFKVVANENGMCSYEVKFKGNTTVISPEEVSAAILMKMKEIAEDYLGHTVEKAVITVPAYFNDSMRQCTKDCAKIAGLEVVRMINEPTAAALAYGLDKISSDKPSNLLIFDFGGGTFDVTVLTVDNGAFEVLSTSGDTHLGGQDFDNVLVEHFASDFEEKHGEDLRENPKAIRKLKVKSQLVKHALSQSLEAQIEIDGLYNGIDYSSSITRAQFNDLCEELYERMLIPVQNALKDAGLDKTEIDEIVLIGGSTRIVEVQDRLQEFFNGKQLCKKINPDEAVALGASIQAANLGLTSEEKKGSKLEKVILMDVTPMSLGIELANGKMSVIIPRNTNIPYQHARTYYNNEDNQKEATVVVYEGEDQLTANNRLLGTFVLKNITQRPRGKVQIEVMFVIDTNGILDVTATVKDDRNITTTLKIDQNKGLLTSDQIEEMAEEANKLKEEQIYIEALKKAKNDLLQYIVKIKKETAKFKLTQENKSHLENLFTETKQWLGNPGSDLQVPQIEAQQLFLEKEWGKIRDNIDLFN